jgi:MYXO-CTERM domain-containing protein
MKPVRSSAALSAAALITASASASYVSTGQTPASVNALLEAGYTAANSTPAISTPVAGDCAALGCMTFVQVDGPLSLKGFYQFQFQDFVNVNFTGIYGWLQFDYGNTGITQQNIIDSVNAQSATTGVYAQTAQQAGHPDCHFNDFLPPSMSNGNNVYFVWLPSPAPINPGLSQIFTFAWDFSNYAPGLTSTPAGLSITGTGSVPAPGAFALIGLTGLVARRRR